MSQLFWYKQIFMIELLLAEALFAVHLKRKKGFAWRIILSLVICSLVAYFFPIPVYNAAYCSFLFFSLFALVMLCLKFCFKESWINTLFVGIAGYTTQHIAFVFYEFIVNAFNLNNGLPLNFYASEQSGYLPFSTPLTELIYLFDYIIVYWSIYMIFGSQLKKSETLRLKSVTMMILVTVILLVDIILSSIITYYAQEDYNRFYGAMLNIFNILCCCFVLYIQFEIPVRTKLEEDLEIITRLHAKEEEQYIISEESINLINLKCHDLKHQIHNIGSQNAIGETVLKEIEEIVEVYDSVVKTGNKALDIILTEKSLLCNSKGIKITCIADGERIAFMRDSDIYSLFGNILDNAIEAVERLEEEKRTIGFTMKKVNEFLVINVHNYFQGVLAFEGGLPRTTKQGIGYHGFGMKSIQIICEKYEGDLSISVEDDIFNLNILFPILKNQEYDEK